MKSRPDTAFARRADEARLVADLIRSDILDGHLQGKLPPEFELVRRYEGSRNAVRDALVQLSEQGLLGRMPRTGTTVVADGVVFAFERSRDPIRILEPGVSLNSEIEDYRVISYLRRPAPATVARKLDIDRGDEVVYLEVAISVRDVPLRLRESWVPVARVPALFDGRRISGALTELIETELGVQLSASRMLMESLNADERTAELLGVRSGAAIFVLERIMVLPDGTPIEYGFSRHRGDRTIFDTTVMS